MPPGPVVSWPSRPRSRATRSSAMRPSRPPTRIAEKTKSAPREGRRRGRWCGATAGGSSWPCAELARARGRWRAAGRGSRSCSTTSVTRRSCWSREQGAVDERDPEAAAAEDGEPHARPPSRGEHSAPAAAQCAGWSGSAPLLVTMASMSSGPHTRGDAGAGELVASASSTVLVGGRDHGPLHGHLDGGGVEHAAVAPDAAGAEEQQVGVHLADRVLGEEADQRVVVAADHAAEQHQLDRRVVARARRGQRGWR